MAQRGSSPSHWQTTASPEYLLRCIEDIQRRIHAIRHTVKQWENTRHERKVQLKRAKNTRNSTDLDKSELTYLKLKSRHQDEEIGYLYEILCATLELQNDEMGILLQHVEYTNSRLSNAWDQNANTEQARRSLREQTMVSSTRVHGNSSSNECMQDVHPRSSKYAKEQDPRKIRITTYGNRISSQSALRRKKTIQKEDNRIKMQEENNSDSVEEIVIRKAAPSSRPNVVRRARHLGRSESKHRNVLEQRTMDQETQKPPDVVSRIQLHKPFPEIVCTSIDMWLSCARDEVEKVKSLRAKSPLTGQCTILCLDISESMEGVAWTQMKTFVTNYLQNAEKMSSGKNIHENVAMVTFGHETCVLHHATTDYKQLRIAFDKLSPDGPSPMYAGLLFAEAAATDGSFELHGTTFPPGVILISDGRPTAADMISGPDCCNSFSFLDFVSTRQVVDRAKVLGYMQCKLFIVPVGKDVNERFLERLAEVTYGKLLVTEADQKQFYRQYSNAVMTTSVLQKYGSMVEFNRFTLEYALRTEDPTITAMDMEDILSFVSHGRIRQWDLDDERYLNTCVPGLPPVGTRVRRGPEWVSFNDEDEHGPGTIVGVRPEGQVHVIWDYGGQGLYSYGGVNGSFEVVIVDHVREKSSTGPGSLVERGPDWNGGDEDGGQGSIGVVYRARKYEIVHVRWLTGVKKAYKFGFGGKREVKPCEHAKTLKAMPQELATAVERQPVVPEEHPKTLTMGEILQASYVAEDGELQLPMLMHDRQQDDELERVQQPPSERNSLHAQNAQSEQTYGQQKKKRRNKNETNPCRLEADGEDKIVDSVIKDKSTNAGSDTDDRTLSECTSESHPNSRYRNEMSVSEAISLDIFNINKGNPGTEIMSMEDLNARNRQNSAAKRQYVWQYRDNETWQNYPDDINFRIEKTFQAKPKSTVLVTFNGEEYRVLLSNLQQVHVESKQITDIQRIALEVD